MFGKQSDDDSAYHQLCELFDAMTLGEWWQRVRRGLHQPHDTGEYIWARAQRRRLLAPVLAVCVPLLLVALIILVGRHVIQTDKNYVVTYQHIEQPPPLDPVLRDPTVEDVLPDALPAFSDAAHPISDPSPTRVGLTTSFISPLRVALPTAAAVRGPIRFDGLRSMRSGIGREQGLSRFGAPAGTHDAILRALRWLKLHQHRDGYWDGRSGGSTQSESASALTGLALLTFLAHGDRTDSEEFGETLERGLRWLVQQQMPDGSFKQRDGHDYAHPICTYALCEAYAMMRQPMLQYAAERAATRIANGQNPEGGWDYKVKPSGRNDLSYSAWCVQALKAARMTGVDVPDIDAALARAAKGVERVQTQSTGRFGYTAEGNGSG